MKKNRRNVSWQRHVVGVRLDAEETKAWLHCTMKLVSWRSRAARSHAKPLLSTLVSYSAYLYIEFMCTLDQALLINERI
jgi:hypothetical protein